MSRISSLFRFSNSFASIEDLLMFAIIFDFPDSIWSEAFLIH